VDSYEIAAQQQAGNVGGNAIEHTTRLKSMTRQFISNYTTYLWVSKTNSI